MTIILWKYQNTLATQLNKISSNISFTYDQCPTSRVGLAIGSCCYYLVDSFSKENTKNHKKCRIEIKTIIC